MLDVLISCFKHQTMYICTHKCFSFSFSEHDSMTLNFHLREDIVSQRRQLFSLIQFGGPLAVKRLVSSHLTAMTSNGCISDISGQIHRKQHDIFNYLFRSTSCCLCSSPASNCKLKEPLTNFTWNGIFELDNSIRRCPTSKQNQCICLCRYQIKGNFSLEDLDLSCQIFLAKTLFTLSNAERSKLDSLLNWRNRVSHAPSKYFPDVDNRNTIAAVGHAIKDIVCAFDEKTKNEVDAVIQCLLKPHVSVAKALASIRNVKMSRTQRTKVNM